MLSIIQLKTKAHLSFTLKYQVMISANALINSTKVGSNAILLYPLQTEISIGKTENATTSVKVSLQAGILAVTN